MVVLLNLLPAAIVAGALYLAYRWHKKKTLNWETGLGLFVVTVVVLTVLNSITPSYMPKGTAQKLPNPTFEQSDAEIKDRNRKPELTTEERQQRFDEKFDAVKQATEK
jgi:uncharacterized membrane protein YeiB